MGLLSCVKTKDEPRENKTRINEEGLLEIEEPYESDGESKIKTTSKLEYVGDPFVNAKSPGDLSRISKQMQESQEPKSILKKTEIVKKPSPRPIEEFTEKTGIPLAPLSNSPFTMQILERDPSNQDEEVQKPSKRLSKFAQARLNQL